MAKANSNSEDTLGARKRKLEEIMRNEPKRVTRYPIRLWSSRQNIDIAANFYEVWLDDKYQEDLVYCQRSQKIVTRSKRNNSNLLRHQKMLNHKSDKGVSSTKQNEDCNVLMREADNAPRETGSTSSSSKEDREST